MIRPISLCLSGFILLLMIALPARYAGSETQSEQAPVAESSNRSDDQPDAPERSLEERVAEILDAPTEEDSYDQSIRCLRSTDYGRVEVLDAERLVFHGRGDKRWLNQLRIRCPGLRKNDTLQFVIRGGRVCEMDSFSSIDIGGFGGSRSAQCSLSAFEPVSADQVAMLKEALRANREAKRRAK